MEVFSKVLAFFLIAAIVAAGGTFVDWFIDRNVRCPKCHRVMKRRHAWYYCSHCDSYVIFDFAAFWRHWNPEVDYGQNVSAVDQT